jgi:hypothetical protein
LLAPDVRKHFPDSESVKKALRVLISAIPNKPSKRNLRSAGTKTSDA